ncbi:MAG TPA: hypothetical protein VK894_05950 [Jiangellales bacterium]|nr:hypothetical protein [Jiangellales bacterium]
MAEPSVEEVRAQIDQILDRARGDEEFGSRLNSDPEATLREAGLHGKAIGEVSKEIRAFSTGKAKGDVTVARPCDYTTCWISWCDHWGTFRTSS